MAIDQQRGAELALDPGHELSQRPMIGLVEAFDPPQGVVDRDAVVVDFLARRRPPAPPCRGRQPPASIGYWQRTAAAR